MRSSLYDAYRSTRSRAPTADGTLPASQLPDRVHDYVCLGPRREPTLLLACHLPVGRKRTPISLHHITVEFGVHFRVHTPTGFVEDDFVVISLRDDDPDLIEVFCLAGDALVAALPSSPSASEVERVVRQFVEVLSALSLPPTRAVSGLWAELWLISVAQDRNAALLAWHADPTDKFDFSYKSHFVEVKATERSERVHEFSYEQLRLVDMPVGVASLRLTRARGGKSIADLVDILQPGLTPELRTKLVRNVFGAMGRNAPEELAIRFDESSAASQLRLISADRVPAVLIPEGSPISAVRFRVNLDDFSLRDFLVVPLSPRHALNLVDPVQSIAPD